MKQLTEKQMRRELDRLKRALLLYLVEREEESRGKSKKQPIITKGNIINEHSNNQATIITNMIVTGFFLNSLGF